MSYADLDPPAQAALTAYVDARYAGASELTALYAAVSAWLNHHPTMVVDEARETIRALVNPSPAPGNVVRLRS
jgi:hypothetical protein